MYAPKILRLGTPLLLVVLVGPTLAQESDLIQTGFEDQPLEEQSLDTKASTSFSLDYDDANDAVANAGEPMANTDQEFSDGPITIVEIDENQTQSTKESTTTVARDSTILWPGFLWGLRGFENFPKPVGAPLYFEDPFIYTGLNLLYLWNRFPKGSDAKGGDLQTLVMQFRVALTDRLQFIATSDGYTKLRARSLPPDEGWNDFAIGLKYAIYADVEKQFILSGGFRWKWNNGSSGVLMGNEEELSPFLSLAKGWDKLHFIGSITGRLPTNRHEANFSTVTSMHVDYEIFENFFPLLELHYLQYMSNADRVPFSASGIDYANVGANDVAGDATFFGGIGFSYKITRNIELGAVYNFPISNPDRDLLDHRATVRLAIGL